MNRPSLHIASLGHNFVSMVVGLGAFVRLFFAILARSGILWRRPRLTAVSLPDRAPGWCARRRPGWWRR